MKLTLKYYSLWWRVNVKIDYYDWGRRDFKELRKAIDVIGIRADIDFNWMSESREDFFFEFAIECECGKCTTMYKVEGLGSECSVSNQINTLIGSWVESSDDNVVGFFMNMNFTKTHLH
jgi:hypothetical protein